MYGLYIGLLLGALNKLPLKLPRRGAGRRHNAGGGGGGVAQAAITFDDVAGVDEAKEELSEIVVRAFLGTLFLPRRSLVDGTFYFFRHVLPCQKA